MKIIFYNLFGEMKNAEQETLMRLEYCFNKLGHTLLVADRNGFIISSGIDNGKFVETVNADFLFTYNTLELGIRAFPDIFSIFFHWSPLGFVANFQTLLELKAFNIYDAFAGTYESDVFDKFANITCSTVPFIGSSVPADFAIPARKHQDRKLFYVGINFERALVKMRYEELFRNLDSSDRIEIYGPRKVYGVSNLWADFKSYKGEIPFDGRSILKKINQAGICLALNSPMHNDAGAVSNRTFEAAASGALIISDDNKFVRKYFKDSVFYIDNNLTEVENSKRIIKIIDWANSNPNEAYEMARESSEIFKKELSLESMVKNTISIIQKNKNELCGFKCDDIIDVICFSNSQSEYDLIYSQVSRQYTKNLNLIVISDLDIKVNSNVLLIKTNFEYKGRAFLEIIPLLKGNYFIFVDANTIMHQRHIFKNYDVLRRTNVLFSYSGCYLKNKCGYITLNSSPILRDEFLLFSKSYGLDWYNQDLQLFLIETIFSRGCALFKKEILAFIDKDEISNISDSVHFYLACCSIIKASKLGRFTYACTTGYEASSVQEVNEKVFSHSRRFWLSNCRSAKTYIKEMNEAFFKYTFEITPGFTSLRSVNGEKLYFSDLQNTKENDSILDSKWMKKLLNKAKKYRVTTFPCYLYKIFSLYCKILKLFRHVLQHSKTRS